MDAISAPSSALAVSRCQARRCHPRHAARIIWLVTANLPITSASLFCEQSQLRGIVLDCPFQLRKRWCDPVKGPAIVLHEGLITGKQIAPRGAVRASEQQPHVALTVGYLQRMVDPGQVGS